MLSVDEVRTLEESRVGGVPDTVLSDAGDYLLRACRQYLLALFGRGCGKTAVEGASVRKLNVTLRTRGAVRGSMAGYGDTLQAQLLDAVAKAARDDRFSGPLAVADLGLVTIELWVQTSSRYVSALKRVSPDALRIGQEGVEVELDGKGAYYKPSVALTAPYLTSDALFAALCRKAGIAEDAWRTEECQLWATEWIHYSEDLQHQPCHMLALRPTRLSALNRNDVLKSVRQSADYLVANQFGSGYFCYKYLPFQDTVVRGDGNPVRASGCAYAMCALAANRETTNESYLSSALRASAAILERHITLAPDSIYISDPSLEAKPGGRLGTSALLLLGLLELRSKTAQYDSVADALARGIKAAQRDDGLFRCSFGTCPESASSINFFPGQALLAFAVMAASGDESCRSSMKAAFRPYRDHFRSAPTTAFVGWHADAWARAANLEQNAEYADFVFEQIDWLLTHQIRDSSRGLYDGGFMRGGDPPNSSSIVFAEALARATALAHRAGDDRWEAYREALMSALTFVARLCLNDSQAAFFPRPDRTRGGVVRSITNFEIRADVVQHLITLYLALLEDDLL